MKKVFILGDSYSTFEGHIPEGYTPYYYVGGQEGPDVTKVEETWWHQLVTETGSEIVLNNSWSGSPIGFIGYNDSDCSKTSSFIYRFETLVAEGFFEKNEVDTVFLFGGTNDNWIGVELGEEKYSDFERKNFYTFLPAICYLFKIVSEALPNAKIYSIVNTDLKDEVVQCFKNAGEHYGIKVIELHDIDKIWGHPSIKGMVQIKEQVLENL